MLWLTKSKARRNANMLITMSKIHSYDIHDIVLEIDKEKKFLDSKEELLYYHIVAASCVVALMTVSGKFFEKYYTQITNILNEDGNTQINSLIKHFIAILYKHHNVTTEGDNLEELTAKWIYSNLSSGNEDIAVEELVPYITTAQMIHLSYNNWFTKHTSSH